MTILHVLDHSVPVLSGYSFRSRSIIRGQQALGLRTAVLTSPKHGSARDGVETVDGLACYRTGPAGGRLPVARELRQMLRMYRRICAVARREEVHVLHAHSPVLNGLPALLAGRRLGLPVVYEVRAFWEDAAVDHGTTREGSLRYRLSRALETRVLRGAARAVTICEGLRQDIVARGIDGARVVVVPNGIDLEAWDPRARSERDARAAGLGPGPVFGFVGSFYRYEGLRFLLDALPALRRALPGAQLLLVGGGQEERALRAAAAGLGDAVVFAGAVPHAQVASFYALIDVFVCPRRRLRLTELVTPLKPLEAMAMARPVLASDVGGHRELIRHEETGVLFPAESAEAFLAEAVRIGRDTRLRAALGRAARAHVARERTWPRLVTRYRDIYASLGSPGGGLRPPSEPPPGMAPAKPALEPRIHTRGEAVQ